MNIQNYPRFNLNSYYNIFLLKKREKISKKSILSKAASFFLKEF